MYMLEYIHLEVTWSFIMLVTILMGNGKACLKYIQSIFNVSCLAVYISNKLQSCMVGVGCERDAPKYWAVFKCESLVATFMYIRALIIWTPVIRKFNYPKCIFAHIKIVCVCNVKLFKSSCNVYWTYKWLCSWSGQQSVLFYVKANISYVSKCQFLQWSKSVLTIKE